MARCHELLRGAIDLHTHSAPSFFDRLLDDVELAEQARAAGMRAVLYKAHEQDTTGWAARRAVPGIQAFGGVVLNHAVGGLNPAAVDASIRCVLATDYAQLHSPAPVEGLRIFVQLCLEQGISEAEIRTMVAGNPARLLGLD